MLHEQQKTAATEYTLLASAQRLRNWRQQQQQ
jgi:hypothetical protein